MAFEDREYMRDRIDGDKVLPFRPAPQKTSVFTIALCVVAALYLLYHAALWWQSKQPSTKPTSAPSAAIPKADTPDADAPRVPHGAVQSQPNQAPAPGTVSKCVLDGKVTYSDAACPKGAVVGSVKLPPPVAVNVFEQQRAALAKAAALQQSDAAPEPQPTLHTPSQAAPAKSAECKYLNDLVRQIDIRALQPQSMQQQDVLREDRKKARDRQFFLGC